MRPQTIGRVLGIGVRVAGFEGVEDAPAERAPAGPRVAPGQLVLPL